MGANPSSKRPSSILAVGALILSGIGFATSVYLTNLYIEATEALAGGAEVESFCNISKGVNCETVAASECSAFLGVPISVYGLEFFGLTLVLVLASHFKLLPLKRWDSLLFVLACIGVPVTIILGWISVTIIQSVCIMCLTVYAVNALMVVMLAIPNRGRLGAFFTEGALELFEYIKAPKGRIVAIVTATLALSQFVWVPQIMGRESVNQSKPPATVASAKPGVWLEQPASKNSLGPENAPIRIEEFTDFQCPFCGRAHEVMLEVVKKYPGKIHLVHRDFPLDHHCNPSISQQFHPDACRAAYFARCAADQDLYWPFEATLFHNQRKLKKPAMLSFAEKVGLDQEKIRACVEASSTHKVVLADIKEGIKRGISGTPTLFVNGEMIVGARPMAFWEEKIPTLLGMVPASSASVSASVPSPHSAGSVPAAPTPSGKPTPPSTPADLQ